MKDNSVDILDLCTSVSPLISLLKVQCWIDQDSFPDSKVAKEESELHQKNKNKTCLPLILCCRFSIVIWKTEVCHKSIIKILSIIIHPSFYPQSAGASPNRLQMAGMDTHWKCHQFKRRMKKSAVLLKGKYKMSGGCSCWCFSWKSWTELYTWYQRASQQVAVFYSRYDLLYVYSASSIYISLPGGISENI